MAGHLAAAHPDVIVWNRTPGKTERLSALGATVADSLESLAGKADLIFICVNRTEDVRSVLESLTSTARPGTLFVDHSTIAPPGAAEIARDLSARGFRFVDAPITGGSAGAQNGQLTIFCGGDEDAVSEAIEAMKPYTKRAERVGPSGSGQLAKMANQIAVGGALLALSESLSFASKANLDVDQIRRLVGGGAGGSWAFENYGPKMIQHDWTPGFSIKNQRKDFGYCREAARDIDAAIPGVELVDHLLGQLEEAGRGEEATTALYERMLSMGADA